MNRKNWKRAMEVIEATPEHEFDMTEWMSFNGSIRDDDVFDAWNLEDFDAEFTDVEEDPCVAEEVFKKYGSLPCGSASCIAGTIQYNFDKIRHLDSSDFAASFLGITSEQAERLFADEEFYSKQFLSEVTKADALNMMQKIYDGEVQL